MDFKIINAVVLVSLVFFLGCYTSGASAAGNNTVNGTSNTGGQGTGGSGPQTNTSSSASGNTNVIAGGGTQTGTQQQTNKTSTASGNTNQNAGGGTQTGTQTNTSSSASNNNGVQGSNSGGSAAQSTAETCIKGTCSGQDCETLTETCEFKGSCVKTVTTTGQTTTIELGCGPPSCPTPTTSPSTTTAAQASNTAAKTSPVSTCCGEAMCNKYHPPPKSAAFKLQINLSSLIGMAIVLSLLK